MGWEKPVRGDETIHNLFMLGLLLRMARLWLRIENLPLMRVNPPAPASSVTRSDSWTIFGKSEHHLAPTDGPLLTFVMSSATMQTYLPYTVFGGGGGEAGALGHGLEPQPPIFGKWKMPWNGCWTVVKVRLSCYVALSDRVRHAWPTAER